MSETMDATTILGWVLIVIDALMLVAGLLKFVKDIFTPKQSIQAAGGLWPFLLGLINAGLGMMAVGLLVLDAGLRLAGLEPILPKDLFSE